MAPLLEDPRFRQTWNNISQNAETATETAAASIWNFSHTYITPCFESIGSNLEQCTGFCFPDREERARRQRERGRVRGRAEYAFDFYDDWDDDSQSGNRGGLLGWGNDELDRLLAGSGSSSHGTGDEQPSGRKRGMSYGTRNRGRKGTIDGLPDPTIIPSTTSLGFLQRLPWKFGGTLRYKPSAADLQDNPGSHRAKLAGEDEEGEPLMDDDYEFEDDEGAYLSVPRTRKRSSTTGSADTSDSFRSRGDLFPSDGEDDAVPLSDEFAVVLERRNTISGGDDLNTGKTRSGKGKSRAGSRALSRTMSRTTQSSSQSRLSSRKDLGSSASLAHTVDLSNSVDSLEIPSMTDLQKEEEHVRREEESEVGKKRQAAIQLATERGLNIDDTISEVIDTTIDDDEPISPALEAEEQVMVSTAISPENQQPEDAGDPPSTGFVPARLPSFS